MHAFNVCKISKTGVCTHCCMLCCMHTKASERTEHMRDAHHDHELTLSLPYYMYGVATGTVAVGNEMQLFCS